jgi:AcrR family transcriptional regulator
LTTPSSEALTRAWSNNQLRILDAAASVFAVYGPDATIDQIADATRQTKGFIYYSFRSKTDLYLAVYERGMGELESAVAAAAAGQANGADRLRAALTAHILRVMRALDYHLVIQQGIDRRQHARLRPDDRNKLERLFDVRDHYEGTIVRLVRQGIRDGSLAPLDAKLAARTLLGGVVGVGNWYRPRPRETAAAQENLARLISEILMQGVSA